MPSSQITWAQSSEAIVKGNKLLSKTVPDLHMCSVYVCAHAHTKINFEIRLKIRKIFLIISETSLAYFCHFVECIRNRMNSFLNTDYSNINVSINCKTLLKMSYILKYQTFTQDLMIFKIFFPLFIMCTWCVCAGGWECHNACVKGQRKTICRNVSLFPSCLYYVINSGCHDCHFHLLSYLTGSKM